VLQRLYPTPAVTVWLADLVTVNKGHQSTAYKAPIPTPPPAGEYITSIPMSVRWVDYTTAECKTARWDGVVVGESNISSSR